MTSVIIERGNHATPGSVYYGTTNTGHRIHMANELVWSQGRDEWVARTFCGNDMITRDIDKPLPTKVTEFCRTCFRTMAWQAFETLMQRGLLEMELEAITG